MAFLTVIQNAKLHREDTHQLTKKNSMALVHKRTLLAEQLARSLKLVRTFVDRECCVVSAMVPQAHILSF
jgi:hypothetical protein